MKESALNYAARLGWRVFPLRPKGKEPLTRHGFKDATTDREQITRWWDQWPDANIGIATGNGLVVLDVDGEKGWNSLRKLAPTIPRPVTAIVSTAKGAHYYFHTDVPIKSNQGKLGEGLDVRAEGGYVVAPPSVHPSGYRYKWLGTTPLAPLSFELLGLLIAQDREPLEVPEGIPEGQRNGTLFRLASKLRGAGLSEAEILASVRQANLDRCKPPLDDSEVQTICGSAARYEQGDLGEEKQPGALKSFRVITAQELMKTGFPPVFFFVEKMLSPGAAMLAAKSKIGKSWMVLDLCLSVVSGKPFLGYRTHQTDCLYLALEDRERRLKKRMSKLLDGRPAPKGFAFVTQAPRIGEGFIELLENHAATHPETRLFVIDTLQMIRPPADRRESPYAEDYRIIAALKAFADDHDACVLLVHHVRKMENPNDPFDQINGTMGIMGALDTAIVLTRPKRMETETILAATGRDIEPIEKTVNFDKDTCRWRLVGDTSILAGARQEAEYEVNSVVRTIRAVLRQSGGYWSGGMQDLMDAGVDVTNCYIAPNTQKLYHVVKALEPELLKRDGILHTRSKNGTGGGKHYFSYCDIRKENTNGKA